MTFFKLPGWIRPHMYPGKNFKDLTQEEIVELKARLANFRHEAPEVSVVIPAWNEENNIYRTLSSLSSNVTSLPTEIVVINNNSSDRTQEVLDALQVRNFLQPEQGTSPARQMGLEKARGKYHLCADSDTYYPPQWIELMTRPLVNDDAVVGVYGRYSFVPPVNTSRASWYVYEKITGLLIRFRKRKREHINVLGFNMGFITEVGIKNGGFKVKEVRKFDNKLGSDTFVDESEDGQMAVNLKKTGRLKMVTDPAARVFTSARRINAEGGLIKSFGNRFKLHMSRFGEYLNGSK